MFLKPGLRKGLVTPPASKSHLHRILIADFLAGSNKLLQEIASDPDDIKATKRCLKALASDDESVELHCGESGSTLRFLAPLAAALGKKAVFKKEGRLAQRPSIEYSSISGGKHILPGNVSSQFVTGLLFSLPLLDEGGEIEFEGKLESRGYVDLTIGVLRDSGIDVIEKENGGFIIPGKQKFSRPKHLEAEVDWSGAAFWLTANNIGNDIAIHGLNNDSIQPDRSIVDALENIGGEIDVSQFPDSFPALTVAAACAAGKTTSFIGIERLRMKESDRAAAMESALGKFGVKTIVTQKKFTVFGEESLNGGKFESFGDHRIAMSIAIGATRCKSSVEIDNVSCAAKSYPEFFTQFENLDFI
jgi:3-phosphoshikimate 1-carboxyvinyltransferase